MAAHDESLLDVVDFFPARLNGFVGKGWKDKVKWRFLADFVEGIDLEGDGDEGRRGWGVW